MSAIRDLAALFRLRHLRRRRNEDCFLLERIFQFYPGALISLLKVNFKLDVVYFLTLFIAGSFDSVSIIIRLLTIRLE